MPINNHLPSPTVQNMKVLKTLTLGEGHVRSTSHKLQFKMLETTFTRLGSGARQRYSALYETNEKVTWKVPKGSYITGITITPKDKASIQVLKSLPVQVTTDTVGSKDIPCGNIAFVIHRTTDDDPQQQPCDPTGIYLTNADYEPTGTQAGSFVSSHVSSDEATAEEQNWTDARDDWVSKYHPAQVGTTSGVTYNPLEGNQIGKYFSHFVVNMQGGRDEGQPINPDDPAVWRFIVYQQAIPSKRVLDQPGAPLVYADASRTLFGNLGHSEQSSSVHISMKDKSAIMSDGTWGIALGFVAEAGYPTDTVPGQQAAAYTGAKSWPQILLDVIVHTEHV